MKPENVIHPKALAVLLAAREVYVLADDFTFVEGERRRIQFMNAREEWLAAGSPFLINEEDRNSVPHKICREFIHFANASWKSPVDPCKGKDLQECETCLRKEKP